MRVHHLVVGVSGSVGSLQALRTAVGEARARDAAVTAVQAWLPPGGDRVDRYAAPPALNQVWVEAARDRLRNAFDEALGGVPTDLEIRLDVVRGRAGPVLVATSCASDLLVVGRGDHGALHRAVHGSVSRYCALRAICPVLVVPPPALLRAARRRVSLRGWR